MVNKNFELIFEKKGKDYFTFLDFEETKLFIKEYYRKCKKCEVDVHALSCIVGCGENLETGKPIVAGVSAFSVTYNAGINPKTGRTIIKEEWFDESNLEDMIKKVFGAYGYEIKEIMFHTDLYVKSNDNFDGGEELLISEEMTPDYDSDNLRSTPVGVSILFGKKKTIFKEVVLALKKINRKNEAKFDRI